MRPDGEVPAAGHGIPGIGGKVYQGAFGLGGVGQYIFHRFVQLTVDLDSMPDGLFDQGQDIANQFVDIHCLRRQRLASRKGKQAAGDVSTAPRRALCRRCKFRQGGILQPSPKKLKIAQDDGQQIVEIMRDTACHLPQRIHPLRPPELLLRAFFLGNVHRHAEHADLAVRHRERHFDEAHNAFLTVMHEDMPVRVDVGLPAQDDVPIRLLDPRCDLGIRINFFLSPSDQLLRRHIVD